MTVYISGKITGDPNYKRHFRIAELYLKFTEMPSYDIINPAKVELGSGATWADYMRHDIKLLMNCDVIYMLKGWRRSKGARLEHKIAKRLGMGIIYEV